MTGFSYRHLPATHLSVIQLFVTQPVVTQRSVAQSVTALHHLLRRLLAGVLLAASGSGIAVTPASAQESPGAGEAVSGSVAAAPDIDVAASTSAVAAGGVQTGVHTGVLAVLGALSVAMITRRRHKW